MPLGNAQPSEIMSRAMSYEPGRGERLTFASMKELHRYRVSLYNTRQYVQRRNNGVSGWEKLTIRIVSEDPPTLWVGILTAEAVGIVDIESDVPPEG